ncbi:MAG: hypothetical protein DRP42_04635 [Tenericutes bacterium]|nr:MAG: hypothetical protein DRP42_04635 [Mycoplasmatota bacterium]
MKLSIVIYSSNNLVEIKSVISTVFSTREKEVEVLVIDESRDSTVDNLFEVFPKQIASGRLKIVSYSKISSAKSRIEALRHITGKHVLYIYGSDRIKKSFLEKMLITIDTLSPEIIEFDVEHIGNVKMNYHIPELKPNVLHSVQQTPSIVAQTSPFLYTKIFKTQFLKNNSNILDVDMNYDSYFSYLIVTMATKYIYVDIKGIRIKVNITEDTIYNLYRQ